MTTQSKADIFRALVEKKTTGPMVRKKARRLGYVKLPDQINLSYSRLQLLHGCPRKYLLQELHPQRIEGQSIHLAFGSAYGAGIAELWRSGNIELAVAVALSMWDYDEWDDDAAGRSKVRHKSFWECVLYLQDFHNYYLPRLQEDGWELAYINGKPGIELLFFMQCTPEYNYQGHIDLLLMNRKDNAMAVFELKTSGREQHEYHWGNSDQTNGYYSVIEHVAAQMGFEAMPRVVYHTLQVGKAGQLEDDCGIKFFPYEKSISSSSEFLGNIVTDIMTLNLYRNTEHFPKRGSNCNAFNRPCQFYGSCGLASMQYAEENTAGDTGFETLGMDDVDIYVDIQDVIAELIEIS